MMIYFLILQDSMEKMMNYIFLQKDVCCTLQ